MRLEVLRNFRQLDISCGMMMIMRLCNSWSTTYKHVKSALNVKGDLLFDEISNNS